MIEIPNRQGGRLSRQPHDWPRNRRNSRRLKSSVVIRKQNGHFAGGEALQGPYTATTLRWKNGKVSVTDGPYAEAKDLVSGILVVSASSLAAAVELARGCPIYEYDGSVEVRPVQDMHAGR